MDRSSLPRHLQFCPSALVICRNCDTSGSICSVQCRRSELADHQSSCAMKLSECVQGYWCQLKTCEVASHNCLVHLRLQNQRMMASHDEATTQLRAEHDSSMAAMATKNDSSMAALAAKYDSALHRLTGRHMFFSLLTFNELYLLFCRSR